MRSLLPSFPPLRSRSDLDTKGTVRKSLGLKFEGTSDKDDKRWVIGDIQMTGSVEKEVCDVIHHLHI